MGLYESLIRPALFSLDAEAAHNLGLWAVANGLVKTGQALGVPQEHFGVTFPNPIGLAAGFDKNGVALDQWCHLGFGFVEVGTVTRHPQPGNPKPRMFRLKQDRAIINRLGFNNQGVDALLRRLESAEPGIPVGVNIGKSRVTPLEEAAEDYAYSYRSLAPLADYVVVNVSSPNTPGLRGLQEREPLTKILSGLKSIDDTTPLFVKVSPDLDEHGLDDVVAVVEELELTGLVATNTTVTRPKLKSQQIEDGGLSGAPLLGRSNDVLASLRAKCSRHRVLIGVGGVTSFESLRQKLDAGADLVQVYTGWVYGGPGFVNDLVSELARASC